MFVFGGFNIHHKDWLTYSGETDRPGELSYNFSISNDLTQMTLTFLLGSLTVILTVLLFRVYFFLLMLAFLLQWLSLHWEILIMLLSQVSISLDFPLNSNWDAPFHCIAYDYSCADWDGLCDHLTDVP